MKKHERYPSDSVNANNDIICDICAEVVDFDDPDWQEADVGVICGDCTRIATGTPPTEGHTEFHQPVDLLAPLIHAAIEASQPDQIRWQLEDDADREEQVRREERFWHKYHCATITDIRYQYDDDPDSLFGPDAHLPAIDIPASHREYDRLVTHALTAAYPAASITVEPGPDALWINSDTDHAEIPDTRQIIHNVWQSSAWLRVIEPDV